nr:hypothetical protein [Tanacetum cinerariifolium]
MSHDVITVGSTMRILLLYRGEYSQWRERFMKYFEEQMDGEAMINSIQNEKKTRKIDRLAISLLIQGLPNDIYSLIDSNETAKDLWETLERQMRGSEMNAEEKKTRKIDRLAISLLIQGLPNDIYSLIDSNETAKDLWDTLERQMRGSEYDPLALVAEKTKVSKRKEKVVVSSDSKRSAKVKDYNYYKTKMLLAKKDSDKQVFLAKDQAWMESSSDSDQEINANMVFIAQIEKVLSDLDESSSSAEETITE